MAKVMFEVKGDPVGWQRTGYNGYTGAKYTQKKTREREQLVAFEYMRQCKGYRFGDHEYISMRVYAYLKIPKKTPKATREKMVKGLIRPVVKPDWDNIGKLIGDALNNVAYSDDKIIVDALVRKFYSENPRTVVILENI